MNTATKAPAYFEVKQPKQAAFTLESLVAALFMVKLREEIAAPAGVDTGAAYAYGL
jgi:hypothetical protein